MSNPRYIYHMHFSHPFMESFKKYFHSRDEALGFVFDYVRSHLARQDSDEVNEAKVGEIVEKYGGITRIDTYYCPMYKKLFRSGYDEHVDNELLCKQSLSQEVQSLKSELALSCSEENPLPSILKATSKSKFSSSSNPSISPESSVVPCLSLCDSTCPSLPATATESEIA